MAHRPRARPPVKDALAAESPPASLVGGRLAWLLLFRSLVVTALLASTVAVRLGTGEAVLGATSLVVYATCAASYLAILAGALGLRSLGPDRVTPLAYGQLFWDSLVGTILSATAGGVESAFAFLYFLNVLSAAAVLGRRAAIGVAVVDVALYAVVFALQLTRGIGLQGGETMRLHDGASPFLTNVLGVVLVAILAGYLTEQLRKTSESLREARVHLTRLEELYAAVLRSLPSGVLTVDEAGVIVFVNRAGSEILGSTSDDLVGRRALDVVPALPLQRAEDAYQRFEIAYRPAERSERVLGGSVARLTGLEDLAGLVVVFQDLSELRRLQRDIARADRLAMLGRFAAGLAHEIRNPLAAMIGCLQLLEADAGQSDGHRNDDTRMLGIVHREAERLSNLVTAFLTYARPAPPSRKDIDLAALVRDTVNAAQAGAERGVALEIRGLERAVVRCDLEQVGQVLWNLIGNALHAVAPGPDGDPPGKVRISVEDEPDAVLLVVEDDGPGVPEELRQRIFEPFFTTRADGTGLGLATSYQIISAHGGSVDLEASELGGARFEVRLPKSEPGIVPIHPADSTPALPVLRR